MRCFNVNTIVSLAFVPPSSTFASAYSSRPNGGFLSSIPNPNLRFPDLGLCRGHERLQGLALSNITDDSDASCSFQPAIIPPSTASDAPMM
jgi:hypothetical protein